MATKGCRTIMFRLSKDRWALWDNDGYFGVKDGSERDIETWFMMLYTRSYSAASIEERGTDRRMFRDHIADLRQRLIPGEGENPDGAFEGPRTYIEAVEMSHGA